MTLHEVLERAAEMNRMDRWHLFNACCQHNFKMLPRTATGGIPGPPYYCPVCMTVFSAASFRMWNPPIPPR